VASTVVGTHDASGTGASGVWLPSPHTILRSVPLQIVTQRNTLTTVTPSSPVPIVWRAWFPARISQDLVSFRNPHGSITNSDLELAWGIINVEAAAQCFDIRGHWAHEQSCNDVLALQGVRHLRLRHCVPSVHSGPSSMVPWIPPPQRLHLGTPKHHG
jgi:hypothetical protein